MLPIRTRRASPVLETMLLALADRAAIARCLQSSVRTAARERTRGAPDRPQREHGGSAWPARILYLLGTRPGRPRAYLRLARWPPTEAPSSRASTRSARRPARVSRDLTRGRLETPLPFSASKPRAEHARFRMIRARGPATAEARGVHLLRAMSRRAHLRLRLSGLLLLLAVAVWPRSRDGHHDRAALGVATPAHLAVTTAARLQDDQAPRPRAPRAVSEGLEDLATASDPSLNN